MSRLMIVTHYSISPKLKSVLYFGYEIQIGQRLKLLPLVNRHLRRLYAAETVLA